MLSVQTGQTGSLSRREIILLKHSIQLTSQFYCHKLLFILIIFDKNQPIAVAVCLEIDAGQGVVIPGSTGGHSLHLSQSVAGYPEVEETIRIARFI